VLPSWIARPNKPALGRMGQAERSVINLADPFLMSGSACRGLPSGVGRGKRKGGEEGQMGSGIASGGKKNREER
jgi:hypothetical protein